MGAGARTIGRVLLHFTVSVHPNCSQISVNILYMACDTVFVNTVCAVYVMLHSTSFNYGK